MTGTRIGIWILGEEIGKGPTGTVYKAKASDGSGKVAAVKILSSTSLQIDNLAGELLSVRRLAHPNIAEFYESGTHAGVHYYAREWVDGIDLATLIRNRPASETATAWREFGISLGVQLCRALNHGHRRSLLHRALKPSNIIVKSDGTIKVTDFGISKVVTTSPLTLPADDPWNSLPFLTPEQFMAKPFTKRSDIYSLGAVLYAATTGRPPYSGANAAEYLHKHCYVLPDRPANFVAKLPHEFDDIICWLLSKDPSRRPTSIANVVDELDKLRGKLERKGETIPWPTDTGDTNLHAPLSETTIAEFQGDESRSIPQISKPLFSRAAVVLPLFLVVAGAILYLLFRPGPSAEEYYKNAKQLLSTGKPDDAERAWEEYLEPLMRKYPNSYADEIAELRLKRNFNRELKKSLDQGKRTVFRSEAERWYSHGLFSAKLGDWDEAKKFWEKAITDKSDEGKIWMEAAKFALDELAKIK